jgi:beta-glucosidase
VVFGETPYAEFQGDLETLDFEPDKPLALLALQGGGHTDGLGLPERAGRCGPIRRSTPRTPSSPPGCRAREGGGCGRCAGRPLPTGKAVRLQGTLFLLAQGRRPGRAECGQPGYDPQFAYGYGLSYARGGQVGPLPEDPGAVAATGSVDRYFVAGRAPPPWMISFSGAGAVKAIDAGAQENGRQATWTGQGLGRLAIEGPPVDLSRQTTGDMAVMIRYRVDLAPARPVTLSIGCGAACAGTLDVTAMLKAAKPAEWRSVKIKLSCFQAAGARMNQVDAPFAVGTDGALSLSLTEVRLASNEGDAVCPT